MKSVPCGYSMNPTWRSTRAAIQLVAGLVGAHLQRGGLAVLTTHQAVAVPAARCVSSGLAQMMRRSNASS
jgi:ABC-type transport system involved in cytochrome c biogenesis ATPase subunit